jgi:quercetin dioxygenase-like cupin family protein
MSRTRPTRASLAGATLVLSLVFMAVGCASSGESSTQRPSGDTARTASTTTVAIVKDVLDDVADPPGAPGRTLSLVRYTIAPGAKLPPHVHPGVQMARIESGTLTYTIESGTAQVRRAGTKDHVAVSGPTTITLKAGDSVVEPGDMVHFGANRGEVPLVIIATLLTEDGHELAEPVTTTTAPPN